MRQILHHKKMRYLLGFFGFVVTCGVIFYTSYTFTLNTNKNPACREIFDAKEKEQQKRICCDPDHYNSQDEICGVKCDGLEVNPESSFCRLLLQSQEESPIALEKNRPVPLDPKCKNVEVGINEVLDGGLKNLKAGDPVEIKYTLNTPELKAINYLVEFFSFNQEFDDFKPLQFEEGKNFILTFTNENYAADESVLEFKIAHEDFFQSDLNQNYSKPQNVLMVLSTFDQNNKKVLQPPECYVKFSIDPSSSYCKNFEISNPELEAGSKIKFEITSSLSKPFGYQLSFVNTENNFNALGYEKLNNEINPFTIKEVPANSNTFSYELNWSDFYRTDLFSGKIPSKIRVMGYVIPKPDSKIEKLVPCSRDFEIKRDSGVKMCNSLKVVVKNNLTGASKSKVAGQDYYQLSPNETIYLTSESQQNSTSFNFTFHNLDNIDNKNYGKGEGYTKEGIKNARPISFQKELDFQITKTEGLKKSTTIQLEHGDLNKIDLNTQNRPKNIQVRAFFKNEDERTSRLENSCVIDFRVE